jgi:hypothetical protein
MLRSTSKPLNAMDFRAVLTWLGRAYGCLSDLSMVCALDVIVACLEETGRGVDKSRNYNPTPQTLSSSSSSGSVSHHTSTAESEDQIEALEIGLLVAAAESCLEKTLRLKALTLTPQAAIDLHNNDQQNDLNAKNSFIAGITLHTSHIGPNSKRANGDTTASDTISTRPLIWNALALSGNTISHLELIQSHGNSLDEIR